MEWIIPCFVSGVLTLFSIKAQYDNNPTVIINQENGVTRIEVVKHHKTLPIQITNTAVSQDQNSTESQFKKDIQFIIKSNPPPVVQKDIKFIDNKDITAPIFLQN